jgi:dTDP-4-amino-4,6-dideoxygalactose transaminase
VIRLFRTSVSADAADRVARVLASGQLAEGPTVETFESQLAGKLSLAPDYDVLTVNSGTTALTLALMLAGVGPGDEVVTSPMTCLATNLPILHCGATPVWADVDRLTGLLDPDSVAKRVTAKTRAILGVDWGGRVDFNNWQSVYRVAQDAFRNREIPVIRDAAHCLPRPGRGADYVAYSFQAIKHLTTGDGGALVVPREKAEQARRMRWFGLDRRKESFRGGQQTDVVGFKWHMNEIAAAIGLANMPLAYGAYATRATNADYYYDRFQDRDRRTLIGPRLLAIQPYNGGGTTNHHLWLYTILVEDRDAFIEFARRRGIEASQVHTRNDDQPLFRDYRRKLPGVDYFAAHQVAIPVGNWLAPDEVETVANAVVDWAQGATK